MPEEKIILTPSAEKPSRWFFVILWACCVIGTWSVIPYTHFLGSLPSISYGELILKSTLQAGIVYAGICGLCFMLLNKVDLDPFDRKEFLKRSLYPAIGAGIALGLVIFGLENTLFHKSALAAFQKPPFWAGMIASLYGGINEEVTLRLFLLTLIYFILNKIFKKREPNRNYLLWAAILFSTLLFGAAHLPMAFHIADVTGLEIFRIFLINGIAGIVFGWLYCTRSFYAAVIAHFTTDLMIHSLLI